VKNKLTCWGCKKPIVGARTVIDEKWHCGACTYKHDHAGESEPIKQKSAAVQEEHLFSLTED